MNCVDKQLFFHVAADFKDSICLRGDMNMGRIREFLNRHNVKIYRCERCGIVEAPFLFASSIRDYGWDKIDGKLLCHTCINHPGLIDHDCIQRHNKSLRIRIGNTNHKWFAAHANFGIE